MLTAYAIAGVLTLCLWFTIQWCRAAVPDRQELPSAIALVFALWPAVLMVGIATLVSAIHRRRKWLA